MACVNCGNRSDSDLCDRCMEDLYAAEYQRQAEQEAYDQWALEQMAAEQDAAARGPEGEFE